jgi:hypothetical protein
LGLVESQPTALDFESGCCPPAKEIDMKKLLYVAPEVRVLGAVEKLTAKGSILLSDNPTHRTLL